MTTASATSPRPAWLAELMASMTEPLLKVTVLSVM
jgi:hypothetical protein